MGDEKEYDFSIDDYCACDVYDAMNEDLNWPENKFIMDIIIDMLKKDVEREVKDINLLIERIFTIMLIFKYNADIQNGKMILVLDDSVYTLNYYLGNRDCLEKRLDPESCYNNAIVNAQKIATNHDYELSQDDLLINNIRNSKYILDFISRYVYSKEAKRVYDMFIEEDN